jgi:eukaryotic-like serine/threonine-protein kinase
VSTESFIVSGTILLQKYRVESLLGQGGMGLVFAARHLALDEPVAIKVLTHSVSQQAEGLARLQREARILARLRNEHVVRVIDLGELEDGKPFMVMEHLSGSDLATLLEAEGAFEPSRAVGFILQALVALAAAHANGVIHRDLKPDNLFCATNPDGSSLVKVLDFGISRLERRGGPGSASMTQPQALMGTPLYMSPEQLRDPTDVDPRSDIWSLGVVLYELVTGRAPFLANGLPQIAVKIATEPPPPLGLDGAPAGFEKVVLRCLEKERDLRFSDVAALARALGPYGPVGCGQSIARVEQLLSLPPLGAAYGGGDPALQTRDVAVSTEPRKTQTLLSPVRTPRLGARALRLALGASALAAVGWWSWSNWKDAHGVVASASSFEPPAPVAAPHGAASIAATPAVPSRASTGDLDLSPQASAAVKAPRVTPRVGAATKDSCNPPYTLDAQGRKRFRHECFIDQNVR